MKKLLKAGDVINIKKGMDVYVEIPEKFVYANGPLSEDTTTTDITIGQVLNLGDGNSNIKDGLKDLKKDIIGDFNFRLGLKVKANVIKEFIESQLPNIKVDEFDTSIFAGEYVVFKTAMKGGGRGHGPYDIYPDGANVTCKKLKKGKWDEKGLEISFYQSGAFTATIKPEELSVKRTMANTFI